MSEPFTACISETIAKKIFGEEDENVPHTESMVLLENMLSTSPDVPLTIKTFKGTGHALINRASGWIRNDYLEYVTEWVSKQ